MPEQDDLRLSTNLSWLPEGVWEPVDLLRSEQQRLLGNMKSAFADARSLVEKYDAEDAAQDAALRAGYRNDEPATAVKTTPPGKREAERDKLNGRAIAARDVLMEWTSEAFARIRELSPDLHASLDSVEREAADAAHEAQRALNVANAQIRACVPLRNWLRHEESDRDGYRVPYTSLGTPGAPMDLNDLLKNLSPGPIASAF